MGNKIPRPPDLSLDREELFYSALWTYKFFGWRDATGLEKITFTVESLDQLYDILYYANHGGCSFKLDLSLLGVNKIFEIRLGDSYDYTLSTGSDKSELSIHDNNRMVDSFMGMVILDWDIESAFTHLGETFSVKISRDQFIQKFEELISNIPELKELIPDPSK